METNVSIETGCMIRIVVVGVGHIPGVYLRDYISLVVRHRQVDLVSVRSYYTEHQKSPFAQQPWRTGSLWFKFLVGGAGRSPWEDFQAQRKIHGIIALCHCPSSPDIVAVYDQFFALCKAYPSVLVKRMFAFFPTDAHQVEQEEKKRQHLVFIPPSERQTLELHMQTQMNDIAACLLMEFESWVLHAETVGATLTTPLDSQASLSTEEVSKAKKRRLGRAQKTIGDYCLLAGSPLDANAHYSTAVELARLTGDAFWHAGAIEGSVCAYVIHQSSEREQYVEDDVKFRYYEVIQLYRRATAVAFELEAILKLARYMCRKELAREVADLLMNAVEGSKAMADINDRLILLIEVARIFGFLGYERKSAFFSRQVAQLYLQQESQWAASCALQISSLVAKTYNVQSKASHIQNGELVDGTWSLTDNMRSGCAFSTSDGHWSTLQMTVLNDMLLAAARANDPLAAWSAAARLLRGHYALITPIDQGKLANALTIAARKLPLGARCSDLALPFVRLHSVLNVPVQVDIVKRSPKKKEWWAGSAPSGPFIYTPFAKGTDPKPTTKQEVMWVVGEPVQVLIELANPCALDIHVQSIYLSVDSGEFKAYPAVVDLPSNSTHLFALSGIPLQTGSIKLRGCMVRTFDVLTEHLFEEVDKLLLYVAMGLVLSDPFRSAESPRLHHPSLNPEIIVMPSLPLLTAQFVGHGAAVLYEGEIREVQLSLVNAGNIPVVEAYMSLTGKQQEHVISVGHDSLRSALPMLPGAAVIVPVTLKAGQLPNDLDIMAVQSDIEGSAGRTTKESTNPLLVIHYSGQIISDDASGELPPGRRLIVPLQMHVLRGLCLMHARLLSMEVPAQISTSPNLHVPTGKSSESSGESLAVHATSNTDLDNTLVKMDPYRGSWGLRLLELELWNPTDVAFEITICERGAQDSNKGPKSLDDCVNSLYPSTRIDREFSARVLIPLERFKLPVPSKATSLSFPRSERQTRAELNMTIKELSLRICVKWTAGKNNNGELALKDAIREALQASALDVLLPDPLTFGFRIAPKVIPGDSEMISQAPEANGKEGGKSKNSICTHELTPMEMLVQNNTGETVTLSFSVTCRDVAGENCLSGDRATVLWAGCLSGVEVEVAPLGKIVHTFALCFLVPGEYTLLGAAVIHQKNIAQTHQTSSTDNTQSFTCSGPPFRLHVSGAP